MIYQDYEIEISQSHLSAVLSKVKEPICLLGGWAVYIMVNKNFSDLQGRNYIGSKDIDLGFHIDKNWSDAELEESLFASSIKALQERGFRPLSFRLVKYFHTETRKELDEEEIRALEQHFMFDLYVDPIVDSIHPNMKKILGFTPIDEPLLSHVFNGKKYTMLKAFGGSFMLPHAEVLLATKINAVSNRDKEHKRIKDIADIYALLWYSDTKIADMKERVLKITNAKKVSEVVSSFSEEDYVSVSQVLGIDKAEISRVIGELG